MKNYALELKWAINFSIASLLWMILEKTLGWHDQYLAKQNRQRSDPDKPQEMILTRSGFPNRVSTQLWFVRQWLSPIVPGLCVL